MDYIIEAQKINNYLINSKRCVIPTDWSRPIISPENETTENGKSVQAFEINFKFSKDRFQRKSNSFQRNIITYVVVDVHFNHVETF